MPYQSIYGASPRFVTSDSQVFYLAELVNRVLRIHYGPDNDFRAPGLQKLFWLPDNRTDGGRNVDDSILIDMAATWNPSRVGDRPAIYTRINDYAEHQHGLGGGMHLSPAMDYQDNQEHFTRGVTGSLTVFFLSRLEMQAHLMAIDGGNYLQEISKSLKLAARLSALQKTKVQAPRPLREKPTHLACLVTIEFGYFYSYINETTEPVLRRIQHNIKTK